MRRGFLQRARRNGSSPQGVGEAVRPPPVHNRADGTPSRSYRVVGSNPAIVPDPVGGVARPAVPGGLGFAPPQVPREGLRTLAPPLRRRCLSGVSASVPYLVEAPSRCGGQNPTRPDGARRLRGEAGRTPGPRWAGRRSTDRADAAGASDHPAPPGARNRPDPVPPRGCGDALGALCHRLCQMDRVCPPAARAGPEGERGRGAGHRHPSAGVSRSPHRAQRTTPPHGVGGVHPLLQLRSTPPNAPVAAPSPASGHRTRANPSSANTQRPPPGV